MAKIINDALAPSIEGRGQIGRVRQKRMAREHFLCSAVGTDRRGQYRTFTVYKLPGKQLRVRNAQGRSVLSHVLDRLARSDVVREIGILWDVGDVTLDRSLDEGLHAATWPERYKQCANCGCPPTYRPYGNRGCCGLCYSMVKRIKEIRGWDCSRPATLKGTPFEPENAHNYTPDEIELFRSDYIQQAEERLADLRLRQEKRQGKVPVEGKDLERKLARLLHVVSRKAKAARNADYIEQQFSEEQRRVLFALLDEIEEAIPWRFTLMRAYELVHEHKVKHHT